MNFKLLWDNFGDAKCLKYLLPEKGSFRSKNNLQFDYYIELWDSNAVVDTDYGSI